MAIRFGWIASTDNVAVTGYEVEKIGVSGIYATTAALEFTDSAAGSTGSYRVRAFDAAGNRSGWSGTANFSGTDTTAPTVPGNFSGTPSSDPGPVLIFDQGKWDQNSWG